MLKHLVVVQVMHGSATKLQNKRTIAISGGVTGAATGFDGTSNISIPVTALNPDNLSKVVPVGKGGTGMSNIANQTINCTKASIVTKGDIFIQYNPVTKLCILIVNVQGMINKEGDTVIGTIPAGYRPSTIIHNGIEIGSMSVDSSGNIKARPKEVPEVYVNGQISWLI